MKDKDAKFGKPPACGKPRTSGPFRPSGQQGDKRPALRSRGFLSHGGAPAADGEDAPSRARGSRSHDHVGETNPRELDAKKPRRPYRFGEE